MLAVPSVGFVAGVGVGVGLLVGGGASFVHYEFLFPVGVYAAAYRLVAVLCVLSIGFVSVVAVGALFASVEA